MGKSKRAWGGYTPRPIPQHKPHTKKSGKEAWCYADPSGLDIVVKENHESTTKIVRLTWRQLRTLMRDYGEAPDGK